ncbi:MAG: hypothetical protein ABW133_26025 [Polyangiaceae bacterium]
MVRDFIRLGLVAVGSFLTVVALAPVSGCTSLEPFERQDGPTGEATHTGSIELTLDVAPGVTLNGVGYAISGNGFSKQGNVDLSQGGTLSAVIGGIPAGDGFVIVITATTPDGSVTCVGTAVFSVRDDMITLVAIHLQCRFRPKAGKIDVTGVINQCPVFEDVTATPINTGVGGTITFAARIVDPDGPASALDLTFSNGVTTISQHGQENARLALTCTAPGTDRITLAVTDGKCLQTTDVDVTCSGGSAGQKAEWIWEQLNAP